MNVYNTIAALKDKNFYDGEDELFSHFFLSCNCCTYHSHGKTCCQTFSLVCLNVCSCLDNCRCYSYVPWPSCDVEGKNSGVCFPEKFC